MLDIIHDIEDLPDKHYTPSAPENGVDVAHTNPKINFDDQNEEPRPRRKIRLAQ